MHALFPDRPTTTTKADMGLSSIGSPGTSEFCDFVFSNAKTRNPHHCDALGYNYSC